MTTTTIMTAVTAVPAGTTITTVIGETAAIAAAMMTITIEPARASARRFGRR